MRTPQTRHRCPRCAFRPPFCLCAEIPHIDTRLRIAIVRHAAELTKPTGSARWAALALNNAQLFDYALSPEPFPEHALELEGAWLLFPGPSPTPPPATPPARLIIPDGTWQQARRMVLRLPSLRGLPRLSLPPPRAGARLRRPHLGEGMSTLEAIAAALELCGEPGPAQRLHELHEAVLQRAVQMRGALPRPPSARQR